MKVALLIAGYTRTFEMNIHSLNNKIVSVFGKVDIFLHLTKNEEFEDKYENKITKKTLEHIKSVLNPKVVIEEYNINLYTDVKMNNVFNHWNKFYKLNLIKNEYEKITGVYDLVIKYRPDTNLISDLDVDIEPNTVYIPKETKIDKGKLKNINDPCICDIFAYGDSRVMNKYFNIVNSLPLLFENHGHVPETILFNYLKNTAIDYKLCDIEFNVILSKCNVFAVCGDSGSGKSTLANYLRNIFSSSFLLECDRYHKWERGDANWSIYSHLNPNANYISKMNQDIFDLKVGKKIYQVDYDHKSGKFTDKEVIETSDNLIICGLHSLYTDNNTIYDLKIFIDTDINLKYSWKINRDMSQRGYTLEKVLDQIKSREQDYEKFIRPQRELSDIVVNFTTEDKFDIKKPTAELKTSLNLFISKELNISGAINPFIQNNISFEYEELESWNKLHFEKYKHNKLFEFIGANSYYDYIIFIILNCRK